MAEVSKEITAAKEKAEAALLKQPGVTGVDIGYKEVGGKKTGIIAIRVLVEKKKTKVPENERIPDEIDGHPTDVIERKFELHQFKARKRIEDLVPEADSGTYTPLKGGISIGPCRAVGGFVFAGTLGAIVTDNVSKKPMLLSNFHVMCVDNNFHIGDTQAQPSLVDGGSCPGGVVGTLAREALGGSVDCAVANVSGSRGTSCEIAEIGFVAGTNTASLGEAVRKRGRTTGLTFGTVDSVNLSVNIDYGAGIGVKTLTHQIGVKPDTAHNAKFGDHGDSGSVVVNGAREVVGLHFAGDTTGYGIANPIADVLRALNVTMCVGGIKVKDKLEIKDLKEAHKDKLEIKEHKELKHEKIEVKEHKDTKLEKLEKLEHKEISKLEHPEKPIGKEKDGKEIKEAGFEGPGPGGPGGGDPGPIAVTQQKFPKIEKVEKHEIKDFKEVKPEKLEHKDSKEIKSEKLEKNEAKDHKDTKHEKIEKNEAKDHKDVKHEKLEKSEAKDHKDAKHEKVEKNEAKEHKDAKHEKIEHKDLGKFEHPEKPVGKEKDGKEIKEGGFEGPGGPVGQGPVENRLAAIEQTLAQLSHFINISQRPDLTFGALTGEPDLAGQNATLAKEAAEAKNRKDAKDAEKLCEC